MGIFGVEDGREDKREKKKERVKEYNLTSLQIPIEAPSIHDNATQDFVGTTTG